jgi:hypothetical protein
MVHDDNTLSAMHITLHNSTTHTDNINRMQLTGGEVSGTVDAGGDDTGGIEDTSWVGKGVIGWVLSSTGRVTVGVGACVVFFPASTAETRLVMMAMADWIFMIVIVFLWRG